MTSPGPVVTMLIILEKMFLLLIILTINPKSLDFLMRPFVQIHMINIITITWHGHRMLIPMTISEHPLLAVLHYMAWRTSTCILRISEHTPNQYPKLRMCPHALHVVDRSMHHWTSLPVFLAKFGLPLMQDRPGVLISTPIHCLLVAILRPMSRLTSKYDWLRFVLKRMVLILPATQQNIPNFTIWTHLYR
jgi:hypothetical protein